MSKTLSKRKRFLFAEKNFHYSCGKIRIKKDFFYKM